jgi:hypothetical protein
MSLISLDLISLITYKLQFMSSDFVVMLFIMMALWMIGINSIPCTASSEVPIHRSGNPNYIW